MVKSWAENHFYGNSYVVVYESIADITNEALKLDLFTTFL